MSARLPASFPLGARLRFAPRCWAWLAIATALAAPARGHAGESGAGADASAEALPCKPGVIRPQPKATPPQAPSKDLLEREREIAELRRVVEKYQERVDDAVRTAYRREREAVRRKFVARITPAEETERARRLDAIAAFRAYLAKRHGEKREGDDPGPMNASEPEVTFRLAELLFEEATDRHLVATRIWSAQAEKRRESPQSPEPAPDYREAIAAYRALVRTFPSFASRDAAMYMIAYCLGEQGDAKGSRDAFEDLAGVPGTTYLAEAWLRVGEYHFERAEHEAAIDAYRRSAESGPGPFLDKALYKLAWSHYRRGPRHPTSWAESASVFAELVEVAPDSPLRQEALQYLAILYADHGGLPAVKAAVSGKPWGEEVIEALAYVWYEQANWEDAATTYALTLEANPDDDDAPLWANRRLLALEHLARDEEVARAREELHARYGSGSVWQTQRAASKSVVLAANAVAEPALLQAAIYRHQQAQWSRNELDYEHAARLYGKYLLHYPGRPAAYDIAFYRAECLYFAGRFEDAAKAYGLVLELATEGPWHAEAAFSRFKAREQVAGLGEIEVIPPAEGAAIQPVPAALREVAKAAEDFTCIAPTDWRVPEALFRAAQVQYTHGRFASARARAEAVIAAVPKEDFAAYAATLVVDSWRLEGRFDRAEEDATRFAALAPGRTPAMVTATREALDRVAVEAGFQVARSLDSKGDHGRAAAKYLSIAERAPKAGVATLAAKALFAAGEALEKEGRSAQAARAFGDVAAKHRDDALAEPAAFRRAQNLARVLEVETAARVYSSFVLDQPFSADAPAAAWNAALLWEAAGRQAEAAAAYERLADTSSTTAAGRAAAWVAAGNAWLAAGKTARAARDFELVASAGDTPDPLRVQALAGLARTARAAKESGDADTVHAVDLQLDLLHAGRSTPESARAAAEAALVAAETLYRGFEASPVSGKDPAKVEIRLKAKHQQLLRAREAYLAITALGDPDATTQALHRVGEGYAALASAIRALPAASTREEVAGPLDEKAVSALTRNLELAAQARVATEWTAKSRRLLARLAPSRFPVPRDDAFEPPQDDVWAVPSMLAPGALLASAAGAPGVRPLAPTLAVVVERFTDAQRAGDAGALGAIEAELAALVAGLPADAPARDAAIAWHDLGVVREALANHNGAIDAFRAALGKDRTLAAAAAGLSAELGRAGDVDVAISFAREWLASNPGDADVRVNLSGALRRKNDAPAALAMAIEALAADARDGRARRAAVVSALLAKRVPLALFAAREGLALAPDDPEAWITLGLAMRRSAKNRIGRDAGRGVLVRGVAAHEKHARLRHAAGAAMLADGNAADAIAHLERATESSTDAAAWVALAAARRVAKDPSGATRAAERALGLRSEDPAALRALGLAKWDAGDLPGTEDAFTRHLAVTASDRPPADPVPGWLEEVRALRAAASRDPEAP